MYIAWSEHFCPPAPSLTLLNQKKWLILLLRLIFHDKNEWQWSFFSNYVKSPLESVDRFVLLLPQISSLITLSKHMKIISLPFKQLNKKYLFLFFFYFLYVYWRRKIVYFKGTSSLAFCNTSCLKEILSHHTWETGWLIVSENCNFQHTSCVINWKLLHCHVKTICVRCKYYKNFGWNTNNTPRIDKLISISSACILMNDN